MTSWKKLRNSAYLGTYDLDGGKDVIFTIKEIIGETVFSGDGKSSAEVVAVFLETKKKMIMNATNCKRLEKLYGKDYEGWSGKKVQVYIDNHIRVGREITDGLRIREYVPKDNAQKSSNNLICADCGEPIKEYQGVSADVLAAATLKKYNRQLCYKCSTVAKSQHVPISGGDQLAINT